jgi:hypothetical protein
MWYFNSMRDSCVGWVCLAACSGVYLINMLVGCILLLAVGCI